MLNVVQSSVLATAQLTHYFGISSFYSTNTPLRMHVFLKVVHLGIIEHELSCFSISSRLFYPSFYEAKEERLGKNEEGNIAAEAGTDNVQYNRNEERSLLQQRPDPR